LKNHNLPPIFLHLKGCYFEWDLSTSPFTLFLDEIHALSPIFPLYIQVTSSPLSYSCCTFPIRVCSDLEFFCPFPPLKFSAKSFFPPLPTVSSGTSFPWRENPLTGPCFSGSRKGVRTLCDALGYSNSFLSLLFSAREDFSVLYFSPRRGLSPHVGSPP